MDKTEYFVNKPFLFNGKNYKQGDVIVPENIKMTPAQVKSREKARILIAVKDLTPAQKKLIVNKAKPEEKPKDDIPPVVDTPEFNGSGETGNMGGRGKRNKRDDR